MAKWSKHSQILIKPILLIGVFYLKTLSFLPFSRKKSGFECSNELIFLVTCI